MRTITRMGHPWARRARPPPCAGELRPRVRHRRRAQHGVRRRRVRVRAPHAFARAPRRRRPQPRRRARPGAGLGAAPSLARRGPTPRHTYGMKRFSILAAFANAVLLLVAVGAIIVEAVDRLRHPAPVPAAIVVVARRHRRSTSAPRCVHARPPRRPQHPRRLPPHARRRRRLGRRRRRRPAHRARPACCGSTRRSRCCSPRLILWSSWGLAKDSVNLALDAVPSGIDPHGSTRRSAASTASSRCTICTSGG